MRHLMLASIVAIALSACSSSAPSPESSTVYRTVVHLNADGTQTVKNFTLTQEARDAEIAARRGLLRAPVGRSGLHTEGTNPIHQDWSCSDVSLWMFSSTGCSGTYELCLDGIGTANLLDTNTYCAQRNLYGSCVIYWADLTRSYWPGDQAGYFSALDNVQNENFSPWWAQGCTNAGNTAQQSVGVTLYP